MLAPFRASADQATRGSRFSSRSASGRLMMGSEGWGGNNLNRALAAHQRQERGTLRTHPTRRPREDIFLPEQNALPWVNMPSMLDDLIAWCRTERASLQQQLDMMERGI